ncbi:MAG: GWxTD domain-containing protein, partial [bacterium]
YVKKPEGVKQGDALVMAKITREDTTIINDSWRMQFQAEDLSSDSRIVGIVRYAIDPGRYELAFFTTDLNDRDKRDSVVVELEVGQFPENNLVLSDIELSTNITKSAAGEKSSFFKNTFEVIPNPGGLFGEGRPVLFFYLEAYNLLAAMSGEKYRTQCWVASRNGAEVAECPPIKRIKNREIDASVEIGTINISKLRSGSYIFNFGIGEVDGELMVSRSKEFFIYNASEVEVARAARVREASGMMESEFANMTSEQLDYEYEIMQYLLNREGKNFYQSLATADARRNFIHSFWKSYDTNPQTAVNEYRLAYLERRERANQKYARMGREGWKTDRGRVYMIYGETSDVEVFPSTPETYPHEIWTYNNIEGGVEFVFIDATGFNEYVLVHSTATGEISDSNWRQRRAQIFR